MATALLDKWGVPVATGDLASLDSFNAAVEGLLSLSGDPVAAAADAVGHDAGLILGKILHSYLFLYSTSAQGVAAASGILEEIEGQQMDERELLHLRAARAWASGEWVDATRSLERALLHEPSDLLALKVAQDLYFFLGHSEDLRRVAAKILTRVAARRSRMGICPRDVRLRPRGERRVPGGGIPAARRALAGNQHDVWAAHALAHVFEMEGSTADGIAFFTASANTGRPVTSPFTTGGTRRCITWNEESRRSHSALYDGPIRASRSSEWLDIVDAASLFGDSRSLE